MVQVELEAYAHVAHGWAPGFRHRAAVRRQLDLAVDGQRGEGRERVGEGLANGQPLAPPEGGGIYLPPQQQGGDHRRAVHVVLRADAAPCGRAALLFAGTWVVPQTTRLHEAGPGDVASCTSTRAGSPVPGAALYLEQPCRWSSAANGAALRSEPN